jgi:hypothetical protein
MGANPYWYFVPHEADIGAALQRLRLREFQAGRYNPVTPFPRFPVDTSAYAMAPQQGSIDDVLDAADEDGTRSILDILQVSLTPFDGSQMPQFTAFPLADSEIVDLFGTPRPTRKAAETSTSIWDHIQRGSAIYTTIFADDRPDEIFFAGYSFD